MIEQTIYRPCVAIIIVNKAGQVLWCRRKERNGWQFPQGGIDEKESPLEAVMRETNEEVGLGEGDIQIIKETKEWYKYDVPEDKRRGFFRKKIYKGQKQKWFLAKLISSEERINLSANSGFNKRVGNIEIKFALPHLSPRPLSVPCICLTPA